MEHGSMRHIIELWRSRHDWLSNQQVVVGSAFSYTSMAAPKELYYKSSSISFHFVQLAVLTRLKQKSHFFMDKYFFQTSFLKVRCLF